MIGFLTAVFYNIAYGAADSMKTNRAVRENQPKAQKWIAEREEIQKKSDARIAAILARYEREDQERKARRAREAAEQQKQTEKQDQKKEQKKTENKRKKSGNAGSVKIETIEIKDNDAFNALFDDLSALFTGDNEK